MKENYKIHDSIMVIYITSRVTQNITMTNRILDGYSKTNVL